MNNNDFLEALSRICNDPEFDNKLNNKNRKRKNAIKAGILCVSALKEYVISAIILIFCCIIVVTIMSMNIKNGNTDPKADEPTLAPTVEPPAASPTDGEPTLAPTPTPRDEKRDRLNELITESYKSLTESERAAFEAAHPAESHEDFALRYFDGEGGYAFLSWTSYGVFSGTSVWLMPLMMQSEYENTVCGYTFFFSSDCRILAVKDGEECEIDDAYRKGWLTEEDIAKLHEIHTLVLSIYYNLNS